MDTQIRISQIKARHDKKYTEYSQLPHAKNLYVTVAK